MSINLSKLWPANEEFHEYLCRPSHQYGELRESMRFVALARNAFDVMMRRGWTAERDMAGIWCVSQCAGYTGQDGVVYVLTATDPFTALVEADKWMCEQEKANAS